jgi:cobyric acid synthase
VKQEMKEELLKRVVELADKTKHVLIASVNGDGIPHIAASKRLSLDARNNVVLTEWFCPGTMVNHMLGRNNHLAIAVWDLKEDTGYQLIGKAKKKEDLAYLDGYASDLGKKDSVPQIQRKVTVKIDKILDFKLAPHTDIERS